MRNVSMEWRVPHCFFCVKRDAVRVICIIFG